MSMMSYKIKMLRDTAQAYKHNGIGIILEDAANTIEELSAKLAAANMERSTAYYNDGWIPCSERLPEEKENPVTGDFYVYPVMCDFAGISDIRYYAFGRGHWHHGPSIMDRYVTHWADIKPLPAPYKPTQPNETQMCGNVDCPYNEDKECPAWNGCGGYEEKEEHANE